MHSSAQQRGAVVSVRNLRRPTLRIPVARLFGHPVGKRAIVLTVFLARLACAQIDTTSIAPHHYLDLYRNATIPGDAEARIASVGARLTHRNEHFGIAAVESTTQSTGQSTTQDDDATILRRLAAQPNVDLVIHDRIVSAHRLLIQSINPASVGSDGTSQSPRPT